MTPSPAPRRSLWIPLVFVGGMLVTFAVNGVLIFSALSTFTGTTVDRAYERGRLYNQVLAEAERQDAMGVRFDVRTESRYLTVAATNPDGTAATGTLAGELQRPLEGDQARISFGQTRPGVWRADLAGLRPGQWDLRARLETRDGAVETRQRLFVR